MKPLRTQPEPPCLIGDAFTIVMLAIVCWLLLITL